MPRIPLLTLDTLNAEQRKVHDNILQQRGGYLPSPYWFSLHSPEFTRKWQDVGEHLRFHSSFDLRLSELAIIVTARAWECQYVWHSHAPNAIKAGIAEAVVEAIRLRQAPPFQREDERAIHDYCVELNTRHTVSEATYQRALALFGAPGMVELTGLTGWYVMVVMSLNAHGFPLPAGAKVPFPPAA